MPDLEAHLAYSSGHLLRVRSGQTSGCASPISCKAPKDLSAARCRLPQVALMYSLLNQHLAKQKHF